MRNPNHSQTFHLYIQYYKKEIKFYPNARFCWNNIKNKYEIAYCFLMPETFKKAGYTLLDSKFSISQLKNNLKTY